MDIKKYFPILAVAVLVNYLAQIPYYLHQYYFPHHAAPSILGTILLAVTCIWFLAGYLRYRRNERYGWALLLSFLLTQVLFYGHSIALGLLNGGGIVAQLTTHNPFLFVVFLIGYINFIVSAYFGWWLIRHRPDSYNESSLKDS